MGGPPPPALFNYTYKRLHLPAFLPCLPAFTPAYLPLFLSSSLHLFISSCLPTFLPSYYLPPPFLPSQPTLSTRPPSHSRSQQASPLTIKPPSRRSPPRSPSASGVVDSPSRRESRVMVWQPFK